MRQRAALLRTVVQECEVLLLDEPFGALDALTRAEMQRWLETVWEQFRWTVLLVTHDVREAVFLADRIYALSPRPGTVVAELAVPLPPPARPHRSARHTTRDGAPGAAARASSREARKRSTASLNASGYSHMQPCPPLTSTHCEFGSSSCSRRESLG